MHTRATLGHYEIVSAIGKGGMGEVWKARDTRLEREVAIKTLPETLSSDVDRLARFEREARLLASLNHRNIAIIHGLEEDQGQRFLVLELIAGDTLADWLVAGAIPVEQALDFAAQIADAIDAAHEAGVIHRDLKPSNIKVTPDGTIKVLDFGLAKAFTEDSVERHLSLSPTLSAAATMRGVILGTAGYMSPEQARGVAVDKRADIWAFGCVLFEMLTGSVTFDGETTSDVMASVLKSDPNYAALPAAVSPRLRALVQRCLQKDPKKRWRDVGDLRVELELIRTAAAAPEETLASAASAPVRRRERAIWISAIVAAVAATALSVAWLGRSSTSGQAGAAGDLVRFSISPPDGVTLYAGGWIVPFSISPDGRRLAFTATSADGRSRLWIRPLESDTAQSISGTEDALNPFWSPDSEWVAYQARNALYRVRPAGGTPEIISAYKAYTSTAASAAWGDGVILFVGTNGALFKVPVQGGQPSPVTTLDRSTSERNHLWPQFLSDGRHFLYVASPPFRVLVGSIDDESRGVVMDFPVAASTIRYVPGYLLYAENSVLWAHPFDESSRRLTGQRRRVTAGLPGTGGQGGASPFTVSASGVLAYWSQSLIQQATQLQWMDRKGQRIGMLGSPAVYDGFHLSRDQSRLAWAQAGREGIALWAQDLAGGGSFPLRFNPPGTVPVWTPDGKQVAYLCGGAMCLATADGTPQDGVRLTEPTRNQLAMAWTASGDRLIYEDWNAANGIDLVVVDIKSKRIERLGWNTTFNEFGGRLSPNDRWLAYVTDQTGRPEVWVAGFPSGQPRRLISQAGGSHPGWNGNGSELYFISAEGQLVAVPVTAGDSGIELGSQTNLFRIPGTIDIIAGSHNIYSASRDGQRFLVAARSQATSVPPINMILNWPQLLNEN